MGALSGVWIIQFFSVVTVTPYEAKGDLRYRTMQEATMCPKILCLDKQISCCFLCEKQIECSGYMLTKLQQCITL